MNDGPVVDLPSGVASNRSAWLRRLLGLPISFRYTLTIPDVTVEQVLAFARKRGAAFEPDAADLRTGDLLGFRGPNATPVWVRLEPKDRESNVDIRLTFRESALSIAQSAVVLFAGSTFAVVGVGMADSFGYTSWQAIALFLLVGLALAVWVIGCRVHRLLFNRNVQAMSTQVVLAVAPKSMVRFVPPEPESLGRALKARVGSSVS